MSSEPHYLKTRDLLERIGRCHGCTTTIRWSMPADWATSHRPERLRRVRRRIVYCGDCTARHFAEQGYRGWPQ